MKNYKFILLINLFLVLVGFVSIFSVAVCNDDSMFNSNNYVDFVNRNPGTSVPVASPFVPDVSAAVAAVASIPYKKEVYEQLQNEEDEKIKKTIYIKEVVKKFFYAVNLATIIEDESEFNRSSRGSRTNNNSDNQTYSEDYDNEKGKSQFKRIFEAINMSVITTYCSSESLSLSVNIIIGFLLNNVTMNNGLSTSIHISLLQIVNFILIYGISILKY